MSRVELYAALFGVVLAAAGLTIIGSHVVSRLRGSVLSWLAVAAALVYVLLLSIRPPGLLWSNLAVPGVSIAVGTRIGRGLGSRGALLAFAITASIIDVVSFTAGPTRWLLGRGGGAMWEGIRYLAVSLPLSDRVVPVLGVGDLLILAVLFSGLRTLGIPAMAGASSLLAGLLVALGVGLAVGGVFGIPFMAVAAGLCLWATSRNPPVPAPR